MNMLQAALGVGCVVLTGALWSSCSSASADRASLETSIHKLSNDWSQAVIKLNEQSALAFTLQTQLRLVQEDHHKATNQLPQILAQLSSTTASNASLLEISRAVSNRLQLEVLELQDQYTDATQQVANAFQARTEAELKSNKTQRENSNIWNQAVQWSNQWHQTSKKLTALESSLQDASILKAQLDRLQSQDNRAGNSAPQHLPNAGRDLRIQLNSNGFVETVSPR